MHCFDKILSRTQGVTSAIEFGANIGNNLRALADLLPQADLHSIEINATAAAEIRALGVPRWRWPRCWTSSPRAAGICRSPRGPDPPAPTVLPAVYEKLVAASSRYVMVCVYYNPSPVEVTYHGHEHALFKRDFAGEILDAHPELVLVEYGFTYHRDPQHPLDDSTWFLMEKQR